MRKYKIIIHIPLFKGFNWGYRTEKQSGACTNLIDGRCNWPKGRALGGTSVINFLIYQRGHRRDYDLWASLGNAGWSYDEVLPYFMKSERLNIPELNGSPYHGMDGFLDVQYARYKTELVNAFINAGKEFGYRNTDPNGDSLLGNYRRTRCSYFINCATKLTSLNKQTLKNRIRASSSNHAKWTSM